MADLDESAVEAMAQDIFRELGYATYSGADLKADGVYPVRKSLFRPLLEKCLVAAIERTNPAIPARAREDALRKVTSIGGQDLIHANMEFHNLLVGGIPCQFQQDGEQRGGRLWLVDFERPENNEFLAVRQFTMKEGNETKRPDIVLFVNGLPLVTIELKDPGDEKATVKTAYTQLQTYKAVIPSFMLYNEILVASDGLDARAGSLSAGFDRFLAWKLPGRRRGSLETLIREMLNKAVLCDIIRFFTVFERHKHEDASGHAAVAIIKKIAACHQYYAVSKAVESVILASDMRAQNHGKGGVIWHTQGSGKSLTMVFFTAKIARAMNNPTVVVLTDRNDLDDQLFDTFADCDTLLGQAPKQADDRKELRKLLKVASGGIVFSTMQKFSPEEGNVFECLSERSNIVVMADEAHRTQYGFKAREKDVKNESGEVIGKETLFGLAKYLRDALPNATYLAFTGTPIEKKDANTRSVFGDYIDIYDVSMAVEDGATVPIYYESRLVPLELPEEGQKLVEQMDEQLAASGVEDEPETVRAKRRRSRLEALVGSKSRLDAIASDIIRHFEARQEVFPGKALVVCMSRPIVAELYSRIAALRPDWHDADPAKGAIKAIMTSSSADGPELSAFHTTKAQRRALADRMKNPDDPLKMAIVCDMWLTGFDVPPLHTMYMDKPLKGHTLMQAIARVNRVFKDKAGGLVVDYLGIAQDLKKALADYTESGGKGEPAVSQEDAVKIMLEKFEIIAAMLHGFDLEQYFSASTRRKLEIILDAEEFILGLEDGRKRFMDAVAQLSAAHALAVPHKAAMALNPEIAFFQAVKARLAKFGGSGDTGDDSDLESAIRQIIDKAVVSGEVVDLFDAAGIKKPDISILSDEFMQEMRELPHRNVALETLKKLVNGELKSRVRKNLTQGKKLLERMREAMARYHNKVITSAQLMEELIRIAREMRDSGKEAEELGLTEYEYAFYTAVAENESAKELMGREKLRDLAVILTDIVRKNASIDWTIREDVKSHLRALVKRTLNRYGYPPDLQELARDRVIEQAEAMADDLAA